MAKVEEAKVFFRNADVTFVNKFVKKGGFMSEGINVNGNGNNSFYLPEEGLSLEEFAQKVKNDAKMLNIYKALDKNGDNILSQDELAQALGAYNKLNANDDVQLNRSQSKSYEEYLKNSVNNDGNPDNDNIKISHRKINAFFKELNSIISASSENTSKYYYNNDGEIIGGVDNIGEFERTSAGKNSYIDQYRNSTRTKLYDDGKWTGGTDPKFGHYSVQVNDDNTITKTYKKNQVTTDSNGKVLSEKGIIKQGYVNESESELGEYYYNKIYNDDGSYTMKLKSKSSTDKNPDFSNVFNNDENDYWEERYYDKNGTFLRGTAADGSEYTVSYDSKGNYAQHYDDGTYFKYNSDGLGIEYKLENIKHRFTENGVYTTKVNEDGKEILTDYLVSEQYSTNIDKDGNIYTAAIEGETFEATMTRIGITDPDDIEAFKQANPRAAQKGWFRVGEAEVFIPKELAEKLEDKINWSSMEVDASHELENWKYRRRTGN